MNFLEYVISMYVRTNTKILKSGFHSILSVVTLTVPEMSCISLHIFSGKILTQKLKLTGWVHSCSNAVQWQYWSGIRIEQNIYRVYSHIRRVYMVNQEVEFSMWIPDLTMNESSRIQNYCRNFQPLKTLKKVNVPVPYNTISTEKSIHNTV